MKVVNLNGHVDIKLMTYLMSHPIQAGDRLPSLADLSVEMGMSVGKLREQLFLARHLGLVSVRPHLGIQREAFRFMPTVLPSLLFAMGTAEATFTQFSQLRQALETSFWDTAVRQLTLEDITQLQKIVTAAWRKLKEHPIHIPNQEHRDFHLGVFVRLDNPFVTGLLESYWEAYDASELTRFAGYDYWVSVWEYHENIAQAIATGRFDEGRQLLEAHFELLPATPLSS